MKDEKKSNWVSPLVQVPLNWLILPLLNKELLKFKEVKYFNSSKNRIAFPNKLSHEELLKFKEVKYSEF